jgi:hypothetical protein
MQKRLSPDQRRVLDAALRLVLAAHGVGVCGTRYGRQLGGGLFEFRLEEDESALTRKGDASTPQQTRSESGRRILLCVFCHARGSRLILLLGGYDKGRDPNPRRQQLEIARARARLHDFWRRQPR